MSLLGKAALVIWHDIAAEHDADYNEWHSREHMPERVGIPGFRRGQRGRAVVGSPGYINWYEVDDLAVLTSKAYLERLNDPTPWTRRALGYFRNNNRTLCRVVTSVGAGVAGHLLSLRCAAAPGREEALAAWLADAVRGLAARPGVLGAHYLEGDAAASRLETEEKRLRSGGDAIADRVVLVAGRDAEVLTEANDAVLSPTALTGHGATMAPQVAVYRLIHGIAEADLAPHGA